MKKLTKTKMLCSMLIGAGLIASAGAFAMNDVSASTGAVTDTADTFAMEYGAGVRLAEPYGIRFKAKIGKNVYENVTTPTANETKKLGMYIVPSAYINNAAAYSDGTVGNYQNFNQKIDLVFYDSTVNTEENDDGELYDGGDGYYYVNGVVADIMLENYGREFVGIAYVETTDTSTGTTAYEFADFTLLDNARTATYVASAAWEDYASYRTVLTDYVYGAYLYENKDVTYDKTLDAYKHGDDDYASLAEVFNALDCSFALEIAEASINMEVVAKQTLNAVLKDQDGADTGLDLSINWTSNAEDIVSVKDGVITAMGVGEATLTASVLGYTDTVTVTVTDTRTTANLDAVDYDLSTTDALTVSGVEADVQRVFMCKGEEEVDVTASATQSGTTVSVAAATLNELSAGEWQVKVATQDTYYVANVTVATILIDDEDAMKDFYDMLMTTSTNSDGAAETEDYYVVVTDNINLTESFWTNKHRGFGGMFDGRGHVIDGLQVSSRMFRYMTGTFKNVAFTNYVATSGNTAYCFFADNGSDKGVISNVYIQGTVGAAAGTNGESFLGLDSFDLVENVVLDVVYTAKATNLSTDIYVVCGNRGTPATDAFSSSKIYAIATVKNSDTVNLSCVKLGDGTTAGTVYADADALVAAENADGKMFDSADGWASYWVLQNDGIYFNGVKVQALTVETTELSAVDYDLSVGGNLSVSGVSGDLTSVSLSNGDSVQDVTASATIANGTVTVAEATVKALTAGEWTLDVATTNGVYQANVTVATILIDDEGTMTSFFQMIQAAGDNAAAANATADYYVVVTQDFYLSDALYWNHKAAGFGGVFDGRGHVIDGLTVNCRMFRYMTGTFKNVAFTNYVAKSGNSAYCFFADQGENTGVISNVYIQGDVAAVAGKNGESFVGDDTFDSVENVVLDVVYTAKAASLSTDIYVVCGNNKTAATDAFSSSKIYAIATVANSDTVNLSCVKLDDGTTAGTVYADADELVATENADGKMFDSADGWASYWEVKDDGIYFSNVKVSERTVVAE